METFTPKQYILNVLNQAMVSLQDSSDNDIMIPQLLQAVRFLDQCDVKLRVAQDTTPHIETDEEYAKRVASLPEKPDTPDIDSIQERNYENRRT